MIQIKKSRKRVVGLNRLSVRLGNCDAEIAGAVLELLLDEKIRKIYGANGKKQALQD